ncbi:hypothetical protein J7J81_02965 [bacterium]|nr:hypothetical protein [bacterium]
MKLRYFYISLIVLVFVLFSVFSFSFAKTENHSSLAITGALKKWLLGILSQWERVHQRIKGWWQNVILNRLKSFFQGEVKKQMPSLKERFQQKKQELKEEAKQWSHNLWDGVIGAIKAVFE